MVSFGKPSVWERLMTIGWITTIGAPLLYLAVVDDTPESLLLGALVAVLLGAGIFMISAYSALVSLTKGLISLNEEVALLTKELKGRQR